MNKIKILKFGFILPLLLFSFLMAQSQNKTITGKITDEKGMPLSGATVSLKGVKSVTTDAAGSFTISIPLSSKLVTVTYVGFEKTEVIIGQQNDISIVLKVADKSLDDVVVVGYNSSQKKATVTGAVSQIKGADLVKAPAANLANNLVGRIPGLISTNTGGEPGFDGANILIRGVSTFSGSTAPLIVIDGVANRPGGFQRLNPNDIESISILKDASASIYGAQAANGVILVTTKRGKSGKPQFAFTYNQGFNSWVKTPRVLNSEQYATLVNEQDRYDGQTPTFSNDDLQKFRDGSDPLGHPNTNWIQEVLNPVVAQTRMNLSLQGGAEKVKYYTSVGMLRQGSQFKNGNSFTFNQYNLSSNIDIQATNNLKISYDGQFRYEERGIGAGGVFTGLFASLPVLPARFPDGRLGSGDFSQSFLNPIATTSEIGAENRSNTMVVLNTLRYKLDIPLINGLSVDGYLAVDFSNESNKNFRKSWEVYTYDATNQTYIKSIQSLSRGGLASLNQNSSYSRTITLLNKVNYAKQFNGHTINAFAGYEQQKIVTEFSSILKTNFVTDDIAMLSYGSPLNVIADGNGFNTARRNFLGRVNYDFRNTYFLELQGRYDGSDKFAPEQRWGFFPSVSAGWNVAKEKWFGQLSKKINSLKFRASWGKLGNDAISQYQFLQFFSLNPSGYVLNNNLVPALYPGVLPNSNFTWESSESKNLAMDLEVAKKLFITVELFQQKRANILSRRLATVPEYAGIRLPVENIGIMLNKGLEASIDYRSRIGKLSFSVGGNFTYTTNKLLYIDEPASLPDYQKSVGKRINSNLMYISQGLFQNQQEIDAYPTYQIAKPRPGDVKFEDVNKDGKINSLDRVRVNLDYTPEIVYGFHLNAGWNGFDLSLLFAGQARAKVFFYPNTGPQLNSFAFLYEGRSTPDKVTDIPSTAGAGFDRPQFNQNTHPFFFRDNSFLRLKNAEIGYSVPQIALNRLKIQNVRVYLNGSNLLTFAKFNDIDPESLNSQNGRVFPVIKTINAGVLITF